MEGNHGEVPTELQRGSAASLRRDKKAARQISAGVLAFFRRTLLDL